MNFWDLINNSPVTTDGEQFKFVIVSGDLPKSGIALPYGSRKLRAGALEELYLYKGRFWRNKIKISFLKIFNFKFVWDLFLKNKVTVKSDLTKENLFSFLTAKIGAPESIIFSIYVGSRKFILPLFGQKSGKMFGVAKIYFPGEASITYGKNEAKTLDFLEEINLAGFEFPNVVAKDYFRECLVVILSSPKNLKNTTAIKEEHVHFLM